MPWATYELLPAALTLGLSYGRATLGQLLYDMSCTSIVDNYHSEKNHTT